MTAVRHSSLSWAYGLVTVPLMFVPLVAWLGRRLRAKDEEGAVGVLERDDPPGSGPAKGGP